MSEPLSIFARNLAEAKAKRTQPKEPVMSEPNAFDTMTAVAKRLVAMGKARDVADAVDVLRRERHPTYLAWIGSGPRPQTPAVVKTSVPTRVQKRQAVIAEIERLARQLVTKGAATDQAEAIRKVLNDPANRQLYKEYQLAPSAGALPALPTRDGFQTREDNPTLAQAREMARELMLDDLYGRFKGMSEDEVIAVVFRDHPSMWRSHREEVSGPETFAPPKGKR